MNKAEFVYNLIKAILTASQIIFTFLAILFLVYLTFKKLFVISDLNDVKKNDPNNTTKLKELESKNKKISKILKTFIIVSIIIFFASGILSVFNTSHVYRVEDQLQSSALK